MTELFTPELRTTVDGWAAKQEDAPPRSEAIRRLVELGLTVKQKPNGKTSAERQASDGRAHELAHEAMDRVLALGDHHPEEKASRKKRLTKLPSGKVPG